VHRYAVDHALVLWEHGDLWPCVDNFKELIDEARTTYDSTSISALHNVLLGDYVLGLLFARHGDVMTGINRLMPPELDDHKRSLQYFWLNQLAGSKDKAWSELVRYCEAHGRDDYDQLIKDLHSVLVDRFCDDA
jgi:hypothetical protein